MFESFTSTDKIAIRPLNEVPKLEEAAPAIAVFAASMSAVRLSATAEETSKRVSAAMSPTMTGARVLRVRQDGVERAPDLCRDRRAREQ